MKQLKAFLLAEADTIIAKDADDAVAVWEEITGEDAKDYYFHLENAIWEIEDLDDDVSIIFDWPLYENFIPPLARWERQGEHMITFTAPLRAWIKSHGRGFLCSTEY